VERAWNAPLYLNYGQTESFGALGAEGLAPDDSPRALRLRRRRE
jgi:hypothetical protein